MAGECPAAFVAGTAQWPGGSGIPGLPTPPFGTRELADLTGNAPASISRVAELLERDAIITRTDPRGPIVSVDWKRLLRRWAVDYNFSAANRMIPCLDPRGLPELRRKLQQIREGEFRYAVTGSLAANHYAGLAEPELATIYVSDRDDAMNRLRLRSADAGANVLIGQPFDPVVFDRTERSGGITYAPVTQVAADLMTGPGRGPAEAEGLTEWMEANEEVWRLSSTLYSQGEIKERRYFLNSKSATVHREDGCWDARKYGTRPGWRSLGVYLNLEFACIEAELLTDKTPRICPLCARLERV